MLAPTLAGSAPARSVGCFVSTRRVRAVESSAARADARKRSYPTCGHGSRYTPSPARCRAKYNATCRIRIGMHTLSLSECGHRNSSRCRKARLAHLLETRLLPRRASLRGVGWRDNTTTDHCVLRSRSDGTDDATRMSPILSSACDHHGRQRSFGYLGGGAC